jgi:monoamine oxidase
MAAPLPPDTTTEAGCYDVVVVGAGLAGLACAAELRRGGASVLVLEGRRRTGGRVHTAQPAGWPCAVELGAQWIHCSKPCHPIKRMAVAAGVRTAAFDWDRDGVYIRTAVAAAAATAATAAATAEAPAPVVAASRVPADEVDAAFKELERAFRRARRQRRELVVKNAGQEASGRGTAAIVVDGAEDASLAPALLHAIEAACRGGTAAAGGGDGRGCSHDPALLRLGARLEIEMDYGCGAAQQSLLYYDYDDFYGGTKTNDEAVLGGIGTQLLAPLVAAVGEERLWLGHRVETIDVTATACPAGSGVGGAVLELRGVTEGGDGDDGGIERSRSFCVTATRAIVVTVPLGVLKRCGNGGSGGGDGAAAAAIAFAPPLPPAKRGAIDRVGFGDFNKVALLFDRAFWAEHWGEEPVVYKVPRAAAADGDGDIMFECFFSLAAAYGGRGHSGGSEGGGALPSALPPPPPPVLVAIVGAEQARALERLSDEQVRARALGALQAMLPAGVNVARSCRGCLVSRWGRDPFARGAYAHLPPGSTPADYDELARPECGGALRFAGEHTSRQYPNTMHGALLSGQREARQLLCASHGFGARDAGSRCSCDPDMPPHGLSLGTSSSSSSSSSSDSE